MIKENYCYLFANEIVKKCCDKEMENLSEIEKKAVTFCLDMFLQPKEVVFVREGEEDKYYCPTCGIFLYRDDSDDSYHRELRRYYKIFGRCCECGQLINFNKNK